MRATAYPLATEGSVFSCPSLQHWYSTRRAFKALIRRTTRQRPTGWIQRDAMNQRMLRRRRRAIRERPSAR